MKSVLKKAVLALAAACSCAWATGYQLYSEASAEALAVSGAAVGFRGNVSNAWYNQAAITSIDKPTIQGGMTLLKLGIEYESANGNDELRDKVRPTGSFYGVLPMNESFTLGLSINAPYGMITEWENDWTEASIGTFTNIRAVYTTPSIAYRISDELSIAAGVNFVCGMARLAKDLPDGEGGTTNKLYMRAEEELALGYNFSLHYQPWEAWGIGAQYQSRVKLKLRGDDSEYRSPLMTPYGNVYQDGDVGTDLTLPSSLAVGIANTSFENWRIGLAVTWTEWSVYDVQKIFFDKYPGTLGKPGISRTIKNWHDSYSYRIGAEYTLNENWKLRFGYMYDTNQQDDDYRSPEVPDNNRHMFTVGCGYKSGSWGFDLAYGYLMFEPCRMGHKVSSKANGYFHDADVHILSMAVTREF